MMYPSANESNVRQLMSMGASHKAYHLVKMTPERIREVKATFKECDVDNSGDVSKAEFIDGIQNAGMTPVMQSRRWVLTRLPVTSEGPCIAIPSSICF